MSMDSLHLYPGNLFLGFVHLSSSGFFFHMFGIRFSNAKLTEISITSCQNINYYAAQNTLMAHRPPTAPTAIPCGAAVICSNIRGKYIPLTASGCPDRRRSGTGRSVQAVVRAFGIVRPSTSVIALCKVSAVDTP